MPPPAHSSPNRTAARERLIVALDVDSSDKALELADQLAEDVVFFKIGLELFCQGSGIGLIRKLADRGCNIFADFKLHDVPATVERATRQLNGLGIDFLTVHAEVPVMQAAAQAAQDFRVLAVTVLTSMSQSDLTSAGISTPLNELVLKRAENARMCGCAGVIASGHEAAALRKQFADDFVVVTPGIRNAGEGAHDQKRSVGVREAFRLGADYIVVGRPIRDAHDPAAAAKAIIREIDQVFAA